MIVCKICEDVNLAENFKLRNGTVIVSWFTSFLLVVGKLSLFCSFGFVILEGVLTKHYINVSIR